MATPAATSQLVGRRLSPNGYSVLGRTALTCSRIGVSTRRFHGALEAHREALGLALRSGLNVVDTASHYADGAHETLVGEAVARAVAAGDAKREEIVLVSKYGRILGEPLAQQAARRQRGATLHDVLYCSDYLWYSISPDYLASAIESSLERLQVSTLDVCLLHDPEYILRDAVRRGPRDLALLQGELRARLRRAFEFLEGQVEKGRIGAYGLCSEALMDPPDWPYRISLESIVGIAQEVAGSGHRFAVIEVPLNLLEPRATLLLHDEAGSLLQRAGSMGLGVLACRPIQVRGPRSLRLAAAPAVESAQEELVDGFRSAIRLEEEHRRLFPVYSAPDLFSRMAPYEPGARFACGGTRGPAQRMLLRLSVDAQVRSLGQQLSRLAAMAPPGLLQHWSSWRHRYLVAVDALFRAAEQLECERERPRLNALDAAASRALPEPPAPQSIAKKALWVAASTPGVRPYGTPPREGERWREYGGRTANGLRQRRQGRNGAEG